LPLLGIEAKCAYDELMNVIVIPLCRSDEIHALLYDGGGGGGGGEHDNASATRSTSTMRVGVLLAGAPGVGKSTLAYHCAAMASKMSTNNRGVTLLDVSATSLIHKEIGSSERAVHSLFVAVRSAAPCILLIDGIDSVALRRGNDNTTEGTMDRVLSTFLTELDGIEEVEYIGGNVAVIGITHYPNLIDPALLRPGRLEKVITLGGLDYEARKEIVLHQIEDCTFDFTSSSSSYMDDYSFNNNIKNKNDIANFVAYETTNMSAVEVIAICREASMVCLRELNFDTQVKPSLTYNHFQRAIVIMKGKKSS
jgi:transitional endoplasmic reticulum ATPase